MNIFFSLMMLLTISSWCQALEEKPLVIGICSYNNARWYQRNLDSIFNQAYSNYRVIYVDDCSQDNTANLVEAYVKARGQEHRFTLLRNKERRRALANHYRIIHACRDDEIIVSLDGDDWFAHKRVLARINETYIKKHPWIVWSQFRRWPSGKRGYSRPVPPEVIANRTFRSYRWVWGQTRTYYAWLAKSVKLEDLIMQEKRFSAQGKFFSSSCDVALMIPMLEMAGNRIFYLNEFLYVYNMHEFTDYRMNSDLQIHCSRCIRKLPRYKLLSHPRVSKKTYEKADVLIVISTASKIARLQKMMERLQGVQRVFIFYRDMLLSNRPREAEGIREATHDTIRHALEDIIDETDTSYSVVITNPVDIIDPIDLGDEIKKLRETRAYAWFLKPPFLFDILSRGDYCTLHEHDVLFWQFGTHTLNPHSAPVILLKKKKLAAFIHAHEFHCAQDFLATWRYAPYKVRDIGLLRG